MEPGIVGGENADVLWRLSIARPAWDTSHCSLQPAQTGGTVGWGDLCDTTAPATASEFRRCSQSHSHRSSPQLESSDDLHPATLRASGTPQTHNTHLSDNLLDCLHRTERCYVFIAVLIRPFNSPWSPESSGCGEWGNIHILPPSSFISISQNCSLGDPATRSTLLHLPTISHRTRILPLLSPNLSDIDLSTF